MQFKLTRSYLREVLKEAGFDNSGYFSLSDVRLGRFLRSFGFVHLGNGKDRLTYLSSNKRYVLKFPRHYRGLLANETEAHQWKKVLRGDMTYHPAKFAPCRLICDAIVLMPAMTKVFGRTDACSQTQEILGQPDIYEDPEVDLLPEWYRDNDLVDCAQVGKMRNGNIVVYDYGDEMC